MSTPTLAVTGGIAEVRLNRVARHNRIEAADVQRLHLVLDRVQQDKGIRVLVLLTGVDQPFAWDMTLMSSIEWSVQTTMFHAALNNLDCSWS